MYEDTDNEDIINEVSLKLIIFVICIESLIYLRFIVNIFLNQISY